MRNIWAVCKREFASYFLTPTGYVAVGLVALLTGLAFTVSLFAYEKMSQDPSAYNFAATPDFEETFLSPFLVFCGMVVMFLSPLLTMRLMAEERNKGTIELLLTWPLRDREIIFGKYLAALGMLAIIMIVLCIDMALVAWVTDVEAAVLLLGLVTVFLMGASVLSLGLFVSSVTRTQITAGTLTFGILLLMWIFGTVGENLPATSPAPEGWPAVLQQIFAVAYTLFRSLVMELAIDHHAQEMAQGVFTISDVTYYILFCAFFLFLTFRALESRQWRA